jgi:hypothetical protein
MLGNSEAAGESYQQPLHMPPIVRFVFASQALSRASLVEWFFALSTSRFSVSSFSRAVVSAFVGTAAGVGRGCAEAAAMRAVKASVAARARSISSSRRLDINRE